MYKRQDRNGWSNVPRQITQPGVIEPVCYLPPVNGESARGDVYKRQASGLVSVTSNLVPGIMNSIVKAGLDQNMGEMLSLQKTFYPLMKGCLLYTSRCV